MGEYGWMAWSAWLVLLSHAIPKSTFIIFTPKKATKKKRITPKKYLRNMGGYGWVARCAWLVLLSHASPSSCPWWQPISQRDRGSTKCFDKVDKLSVVFFQWFWWILDTALFCLTASSISFVVVLNFFVMFVAIIWWDNLWGRGN